MDRKHISRLPIWTFLQYCCVLIIVLSAACAREYQLAFVARSSTSSIFYWGANIAAASMAVERATKEGLLGNNAIRGEPIEFQIRYDMADGEFFFDKSPLVYAINSANIPSNRYKECGVMALHDGIIVSEDGCGNVTYTMGTFVQMHEQYQVDGFIGLGCSSGTVNAGFLATYWNIPMLSQGSASDLLADRELYPTLIRLLPPFNKMGQAVREVILHYGWKKIFMFSRDSGLSSFVSRALFNYLAEDNVTVISWLEYSGDMTPDVIDNALSIIREKARIVFICGRDLEEVNFMLRAHELNMTSPDYVYISPAYRPYITIIQPWLDESMENRDVVREAMVPLIQIATMSLDDVEADEFNKEHKRRMAGPPWYMNDIETAIYASVLHDSVYVYALTLNQTLEAGEDPRDGKGFVNRAKRIRVDGVSGSLAFDEDAERQPLMSVYCLLPDHNVSTLIAEVDLSAIGERFKSITEDIWRTADGLPPPDTPPCGFHGERCMEPGQDPFKLAIGVVCGIIVLLFIGIVTAVFKRRRMLERDLQLMLWRIQYEELNYLSISMLGTQGSLGTLRIQASRSIMFSTRESKRSLNFDEPALQLFTKVAIYRGQVVSVKRVDLSIVNLKRSDQLELKVIRDLNHENINPFLGACVDPPNICIINLYSNRGSLQDILENESVTLDNVFKESFIFDIIKALEYIHSSPLRSHGKLKSSNCVIDSRWVLKVSDFDPSCLWRSYEQDAGEYEIYRGMLWTAPEILRMTRSQPRGTPEGDVYSFAIIIQEIMYRALPFFLDLRNYSPKDVIDRVTSTESPPYRPACSQDPNMNAGVLELMKRCWDENANARPMFTASKRAMQKHISGKSLNIVDNVLHKLEVYSVNLEELVGARTKELLEEKKKTDQLLYQMLPQVVAERLMKGQSLTPEFVDDVTIYFSDICDFTSLSAESDPMQIVRLLNSLYEMIDNLIKRYDVYKVETINDAYMVVSGLPNRNGRKHMTEIADMSLDILSSCMHFRIYHQPDRKLQLRIGIHTGSCCAGVVGLSMPRYCLFGDTVNMASRMESTGDALRIHISKATQQGLIETASGYLISKRGEISVKGKGIQTTYWLQGKESFDKPLPMNNDDDNT